MNLNLKYYISKTDNPYFNLATEEYLTFMAKKDEIILYLWQNGNTVVVGRNQNAWKECNMSLMEKDRVKLIRRMSGGGAVYHDTGNLNFTFCARKNNFDKERQAKIIIQALKNLDINAIQSGRNDLLVDDRKFSGNAYFYFKDFCYHHGTLMVDVDKTALSRYLNVSKDKLKSHSIDSIRSRVINLKEVNPIVSVEKLKRELILAFEKEYGETADEIKIRAKEEKCIGGLIKKYETYDWNYGRKIPFDRELNGKFHWGEFMIRLSIDEGFISNCQFFSDALEADLPIKIKEKLEGKKYTRKDILGNYNFTNEEMVKDVIGYVAENL